MASIERLNKRMVKEMETTEIIREVMVKYNECRIRWIKKFGNDKGFDKWFSSQISKWYPTDEAQ